jgi:protein-S-isoprenylcysteine O-methyltransferase Ste14
MRPSVKIAITIFLTIACAHLLRLLFLVPMSVGDWSVPQWISLLGVILPLLVAALLWRDDRR